MRSEESLELSVPYASATGIPEPEFHLKISVVIPTFNRRRLLLECLKSVAAQHYAPHEIIVIDDGSTDGTYEALCAVPGVTVFRQENAGQSAARDHGAKMATGEYLAFLDSDDLWLPWSLESVATLIKRYGAPTLLSASFTDFSGDPPAEVRYTAPDGTEFQDFFSSFKSGAFVGAGTMFVNRAKFLAAGGFWKYRECAEDHDLALRLGDSTGFVQTKSPIILLRRMHEKNVSGDIDGRLGGAELIVAGEIGGRYPGGGGRKLERREIITRDIRPVVLEGVREGRVTRSFRLYARTFLWNLLLGRLAFILAVPALCLWSMFRPARANGGRDERRTVQHRH